MAAMNPRVSLSQAAWTWLRIGLLSFGGPAGQIAVMHRIVVEEKRWVSEERFLRALNCCTLLPGPEAQQLVTWLGWSQHGMLGGLVSGGLFVLPGALVMLGLSAAYAAWHTVPVMSGVFFGINAAVVALVAEALIRISRRALIGHTARLLAVASFLAIFLLNVPFPAVVLGAGLIGARWPERVARPGSSDPEQRDARWPSLRRTLGVLAVGLILWWAPLGLLAGILGREHLFTQLGLFFSQAAVVTFGGAYAVLAYMAQHVVQDMGWISAGAMVDGLGLAETTPGPLILVVQFVAFNAAFQHPGPLGPWGAGLLGSAVALWVTFAPSFLWIFLGAPVVDAIAQVKRLQGALGAITAAVVGVIASLSLWFTLHVVFRELAPVELLGRALTRPVWSSVDPLAVAGVVLALLFTFRWHVGLAWLLGGAALLGALSGVLG